MALRHNQLSIQMYIYEQYSTCTLNRDTQILKTKDTVYAKHCKLNNSVSFFFIKVSAGCKFGWLSGKPPKNADPMRMRIISHKTGPATAQLSNDSPPADRISQSLTSRHEGVNSVSEYRVTSYQENLSWQSVIIACTLKLVHSKESWLCQKPLISQLLSCE